MKEEQMHENRARKIRALKLFDSTTFAEKIWTRVPGGLLVSTRPFRMPETNEHGYESAVVNALVYKLESKELE